jgi:hypothetical protein
MTFVIVCGAVGFMLVVFARAAWPVRRHESVAETQRWRKHYAEQQQSVWFTYNDGTADLIRSERESRLQSGGGGRKI